MLFEQDHKIHAAATNFSVDQLRYTLLSLFLFLFLCSSLNGHVVGALSISFPLLIMREVVSLFFQRGVSMSMDWKSAWFLAYIILGVFVRIWDVVMHFFYGRIW